MWYGKRKNGVSIPRCFWQQIFVFKNNDSVQNVLQTKKDVDQPGEVVIDVENESVVVPPQWGIIRKYTSIICVEYVNSDGENISNYYD